MSFKGMFTPMVFVKHFLWPPKNKIVNICFKLLNIILIHNFLLFMYIFVAVNVIHNYAYKDILIC